eukprot:gnl/TRDRNA2_/TRDRNA2_62478_c0_seq2.p1 gnl/TRDRNA2_/TRDRNA2_62478_c0~~gnl/TRDRNA2_/TRDRNA2_62478_c0_seq2.p1  ORF type:complete len:173 (-),score=12.33 gnl/TRDRNA2_/TRDRNA2_62478_c0_seq2:40-558(-)
MPLKCWYGVEDNDPSDRPHVHKLLDSSVQFTYTGVEMAADRVLEHIRSRGPFDVLLGFSQGCVMSHLALGILRERGQQIPLRLGLFFNGLAVRDDKYKELFREPIDLPAIMVFGKQDQYYEYGRDSQTAMYTNPVVLEHDEGHRFPTRHARGQAVYRECVRQIRRHCGLPPE